MKSNTPKVLHRLGNKPMISHTVELAQTLMPASTVIVARPENIKDIQKITSGKLSFATQRENEGTAAAVMAALPFAKTPITAVLYGDDTAFYKTQTIEQIYKKHKASHAVITIATLHKGDPQGLGRIIRKENNVQAIIEEKDATKEQKAINEVSVGLFFINTDWLKESVAKLLPSPVTGEYYLTDLVKIAQQNKQKVDTFKLDDPAQWHGINTAKELEEANSKLLRKIHIMGIAGAGASALGAIASAQGYEVTGCDLYPESAYKNNLAGISVKEGHSPDHLRCIGQLILSEAILKNDPNNSEVASAREQGIPTLLWEQFQARVLQKDKFVIAIAGAYGKSTTTAMVSKMLTDAGLDPTCEIGAKILEWGVNFRIGKSNYYICEVDEYYDKFQNYSPDIAIILNLGWDHPDYFKSEKDLIDSYKKFVRGIKSGGKLIVPQSLIPVFKSTAGHLQIVPIQNYGNYQLDIIGSFRRENADAAMTLASQLGIASSNAKKSIESFRGTGRRLELKGRIKNTIVYDDYAVQPYTILKTANALAEKYAGKKMALVFEPHTFSRINKFFEHFVRSLKEINADHIYVTSVFAAREKGDIEKLSKAIVKSVGPNSTYSGSIEQTAKSLKGDLDKYDVVLSMGAGSVYKIYDLLKAND